jgi:uncharacterized YccA/Bax inhibitor family protein
VADLFRTSNPALNQKAFQVGGAVLGDSMTLSGTVNKTGILLVCVVASAAWTWNRALNSENPATVMPLVAIGAIGGLIVAMVTVFKKEWAAITSPIYALLEGLVLGGVSVTLNVRYPRIPLQAVALTFGTLFALLLAYRSGLIRATEKFRLGVVAATGGIMVFYMVSMVLGFFGIRLSVLYSASPLSIGISVVIVIVAALNLVLDFDFIESGVRAGAPRYMEWYGAFGLMVTLIWLYLEILRLLTKLRSRE